ncbi:MAG: NAD(P)H-dependent oxidoreductase [Planctomycetia bacterium]|nr:NAD(P)H-dependent oxidoreductase [Planctomycetia bacterium]
MKTLVIVAHPNTDQSFNHAIVDRIVQTLKKKGDSVLVRDLYAEQFDPVMPINEDKLEIDELPPEIQTAMKEVKESDALIFVHPNWWGTPPAILKGWIDRVLRNGFAYKFSNKGPVQLLNDKIVRVFSTSNTPKDVEVNVYHDPLQNFWETIVFGLCGAKSFQRRNFESIILSSEEERKQWLNDVEKMVSCLS